MSLEPTPARSHTDGRPWPFGLGVRGASDARVSTLIAGYCAAGLGAALFATKAIFVKLAYKHGVDAGTFLALRMLIAGPIFALIGIWAWRRRKAPVTARMLLGACAVGVLGYYGASWLDFLGLKFISANLERVILLTYPMFVIFLGALLFRAPIRSYALGSALISYSGLLVLFVFGVEARSNSQNVIIGAALVFGSGLAYALYQLLAKRYIDALGSSLFTSIALVAASFAILLHFGLAHSPRDLELPPDVLILGLLIGIFSTVLPALLISMGLKYAGSEATAIIGTLSPWITILLAVVFLHEHFGWTEAVGSTLVVGAVAFFTYADMREKKRALPAVAAPEA